MFYNLNSCYIFPSILVSVIWYWYR